MTNTREMRIEQVEDILAKWEFFYGQRAGRELWAEKPKDVQEKDIEAFNRDISFVRDFVRGVTIQQWIPVTERLPEYGQQVIVYLGNLLSKQVMAYHFWSKDFDIWANVTHWMQLPEPPKGE